ncbi:hydroxylamine oxidase [candidate division KSB3 bacterium]|uniref:Hydroxylamine oxidase n=1 Tax=candidate division KSB3 bacterium TaxID=2044937 RepID=A0A9D5Q4M2_9BACT|nr:hydroxylamine oxidase [candidate division KSB3 bacterium]MBD3323428.1 hydroxylamine oxidase [candidate division KSB3 bacterium]
MVGHTISPRLKEGGMMKHILSLGLVVAVVVGVSMTMPGSHAEEAPKISLSSKSKVCLGCHSRFTPGLVADWRTSRHATVTPAEALEKPDLERRVSAESIPDELAQTVVSCYECHSLNVEQHEDSFDHMGTTVNVVVSPNDCQTCHPVEVEQYSHSKKAYAPKNLMENPIYHTLTDVVIGVKTVESGELISQPPSQLTENDVCLGCHGTQVEVKGMKTVTTSMGELSLPDLANWPNQGVGRINPDGSRGACTSCHTRHGFSLKEARSFYTCAQCHGDPDVPAAPVYKVSKHGNIFAARHQEWTLDSVPWVVGQDFTAPTCATCHNSLLATHDGETIIERTHDFGERLYLRIFGLIYSHPQPKSGDTTIIENADGLPLPTTFTGDLAQEYLIDEAEQQRRLERMKTVCKSCHSTSLTDQHFVRFENTVKETDQMVLAATQLMVDAWEQTLEDNSNPFDEGIEQLWIKQWLFYANTVRYASAMTGGYKYTAFKDGWWELTNILQEMHDKISAKQK